MFYNLRIFRPKQDDSAFNKTAKSAPLNNTKDTNGKYVCSFHERREEYPYMKYFIFLYDYNMAFIYYITFIYCMTYLFYNFYLLYDFLFIIKIIIKIIYY